MRLQGVDIEEARGWMTPEIRALLGTIQGRHAVKKRTTVIKLAFAKAKRKPMEEVFKGKNTCNARIWWQKWQYDPLIERALEACTERALEWEDEETAALEAQARMALRRGVAEHAPEAPAALASVMGDGSQPGSNRIAAAKELRVWLLKPEQVGDGTGAIPVKVAEIDAEIERELARLAGGGENGNAGQTAGDADAAAVGPVAE